MKIIIDNKIPYIRGVFEPYAEVLYLPGNKTTADIVKDADVIITRTRTICNEELLAGSAVKFIASATIGYDHIDTDYCNKANIAWTNAPGCNSKSVEQYLASALMVLAKEKDLQLDQLTIGIIGVGNVGSKVAHFCELLGMNVLLNDPPRERKEGSDQFVSLEQIKEKADIISLHVPLNMTGDDATFHLVDEVFFSSLKKQVILINTCRGEVVQTEAVKKAIQKGQLTDFVCDCWENEPHIDLELLEITSIATPHIAGYSRDGKAMGTTMSVQAINSFFQLGMDDWQAQNIEPLQNPYIKIKCENKSLQQILSEAILHTYNIREDDKNLKIYPSSFEEQRGDYPVRREFPSYTIKLINADKEVIDLLKQIGFKVR